jgi:hypothetical protein
MFQIFTQFVRSLIELFFFCKKSELIGKFFIFLEIFVGVTEDYSFMIEYVVILHYL